VECSTGHINYPINGLFACHTALSTILTTALMDDYSQPDASSGSIPESASATTKRWRKTNRDRAYEQVKRWRARYPETYRAIARKSQAKWRAKRKALLAQIASAPQPAIPIEPDPWLT